MLKRRHTAERAALAAAAALERLDAAVREAEERADVAWAVLASLMPVDVAALLVEQTPARMRLGQQRAAEAEVTSRMRELTGAAPGFRRRGRPPGRGPRRSGERVRGGPLVAAEEGSSLVGTADGGGARSTGAVASP
jgi:hypothetical protein